MIVLKGLEGLQQPSIPVSYLQLLVEIVNEHGHSREQLLAGMSLPPEVIERSSARLSAQQWTLLVLNAIRLCRNPGLGYEFGLRMRPTANGFLGYATMSCGSMREALELTLRYMQTRQRQFTLRLKQQADWCDIELHENQRIPVLRAFFIENILIGIARGAATVMGMALKDFSDGEIWFDWPEPAHYAAYRERLPRIRFSRPVNLLRFPARMLDLRPALADPHASRQAIELCERELAELGGVSDHIVPRVCAELVLAARGGYPNQEQVARRLHMSSRSLARKLLATGGSYQALLEQTRRRDACELIELGGLDFQTLAAKLGYRNPANFTRAFRKWTGQSPSEYRARWQAQQGRP